MMHYPRFSPNLYSPFSSGWPGILTLLLVFLLLVLWSVFWKGWALWEAARNEKKWWFVAILVINTVGILEIAYLFFFSSNFQSNQKKIKKLFSK